MNSNKFIPIDACIFDFFGVISTEVAPRCLKKYMSPDRASMVLHETIHKADWGKITEGELFRELSIMVGTPASTIRSEWMSLSEINPRVINTVNEIHRNTKTGLLTNGMSGFVWEILKNNNLYNLFDEISISSEEQCGKPELLAFQKILNKLMTEPGKSLMVDDKEKNIISAQEYGMNAIKYDNPLQLEMALNKYFALQ